ncbi:MAG: hypothetical protein J3K34DRAFT_430828 [Monoraphidium minutum]|nr:MAG: hypothetical protein J3K34DRAFT_430828 [Monoraphidium minutum]
MSGCSCIVLPPSAARSAAAAVISHCAAPRFHGVCRAERQHGRQFRRQLVVARARVEVLDRGHQLGAKQPPHIQHRVLHRQRQQRIAARRQTHVVAPQQPQQRAARGEAHRALLLLGRGGGQELRRGLDVKHALELVDEGARRADGPQRHLVPLILGRQRARQRLDRAALRRQLEPGRVHADHCILAAATRGGRQVGCHEAAGGELH